MLKSQKLPQKRNLQLSPLALRQMSYVPRPEALHMGITPTARAENTRARHILHFNIFPGKLTRARRTQTNISEIYQTHQQKRRQTAPILCLHGIWLSLWQTPLPWNILRKATYLRKTPQLGRKIIHNRPNNRGRLGPRINLFQGLSCIRPGHEHRPLCSQLHFEEQMGELRFSRDKRMGPHVPEALPRATGSETSYRRRRNKERIAALRNYRDNTQQIQNGWQKLEDTAPYEA